MRAASALSRRSTASTRPAIVSSPNVDSNFKYDVEETLNVPYSWSTSMDQRSSSPVPSFSFRIPFSHCKNIDAPSHSLSPLATPPPFLVLPQKKINFVLSFLFQQ
jgi:hypothetical protein